MMDKKRYSRFDFLNGKGNMAKSKRSQVNWYLIISLILGIIILIIVVFWIFQEYFTGEDVDKEMCRQSIILRNNMPEEDLIATVSLKGVVPLKCMTEKIDITYVDEDRAEKEIADALARTWWLVGEGKYKFFPGASFVFREADTPCIIAARIHLDEKVAKDYSGNKMIDIKRALQNKMPGSSQTYWDYLNLLGERKAFMYFKEWTNGGFWAEQYSETTWSGISDSVKSFHLPQYFYPDRGDLLIVYVEPVTEGSLTDERGVKPYLIFLQQKDIGNLETVWAKYEATLKSKVCSSIESAPA